jgi:hypothetical protein
MLINVSPNKVARSLAILVLGIGVVGTAAEFLRQATESWSHRGLAQLAGKFELDAELSFPAWYSSVAILACSGLLAVIALAERRARSRYAAHWLGLAVIFLLMSIDELAAVHEMFIVPMRRHFGASGLFHYGWVVPALFFVACFGIAYVRFVFLHLDARARLRFIAAGLIYVGAALGLELVEGPVDVYFGLQSVPARAAVAVEETLEMLGIVVFLFALLSYIGEHVGEIRFRVRDESATGVICESTERTELEHAAC